MQQPKRHLARMVNTDQRLVVVLMQIPGREDHALVVSTDSLPPRFEQVLMGVLESPEGQTAQDLATVLGRRMMPDTTMSLMAALHNAGMLFAVPVDNVVMYPFPNRSWPLRQVLESMGRVVAPGVAAAYAEAAAVADAFVTPPLLEEAPAPAAAPSVAETQRFNPHTANQQAAAVEGQVGIAQTLLMEANDLEFVAKQKREQAYEYAPQLRPAPAAAPAPAPAPVVADAATARRRGAEVANKRPRAKKAQG